MIRTGGIDKEYIDKVIQEAMMLTGGVEFSNGAKQVGCKNGRDPSHVRAYQDDIRPDTGGRLFAERKNAAKNEIGVLLIYDKSINNFLKAMGKEAIEKFCKEVMIAVAMAYLFLIDQKVRARQGADGEKKQTANVIAVICPGILSRNGELSAHTHIAIKNYVLAQDGKVRSGDMRPLMVRDEKLNRMVQNLIAAKMEEVFGVKMIIEPKHGMARIEGVPTEQGTERRQAAIEYLEKEKVESRSRVAMAYAFQNTRPAKPDLAKVDIAEKSKQWQAQSWARDGKIEPKLVRENERGLFARIAEDFIKLPIEVFATAWKARKGHGQVRGHVLDVQQFINDTKSPSKADRHRAAIKAVRNTRCESFSHALTVAEHGYKNAMPKLVLPKGTRVAVNAKDITNKEQLHQLEKLAKKNEWRLRVRGELKEEQNQKQSL